MEYIGAAGSLLSHVFKSFQQKKGGKIKRVSKPFFFFSFQNEYKKPFQPP